MMAGKWIGRMSFEPEWRREESASPKMAVYVKRMLYLMAKLGKSPHAVWQAGESQRMLVEQAAWRRKLLRDRRLGPEPERKALVK